MIGEKKFWRRKWDILEGWFFSFNPLKLMIFNILTQMTTAWPSILFFVSLDFTFLRRNKMLLINLCEEIFANNWISQGTFKILSVADNNVKYFRYKKNVTKIFGLRGRRRKCVENCKVCSSYVGVC